jgi:hypothetical protein
MPDSPTFRHLKKGYTLHVHTTGGEKVYALHVHTAGCGNGYTLQVHTAGVGGGERDAYCQVNVQTACGGK